MAKNFPTIGLHCGSVDCGHTFSSLLQFIENRKENRMHELGMKLVEEIESLTLVSTEPDPPRSSENCRCERSWLQEAQAVWPLQTDSFSVLLHQEATKSLV